MTAIFQTKRIGITCCFSGPRSKNAVQEAIWRGYRHFISGMAVGVDMLAAKIVLQMREDMPDKRITLEVAVPFPGQPKRWKEETKLEYESILSWCDKVHFLPIRFLLLRIRRGIDIWSKVHRF